MTSKKNLNFTRKAKENVAEDLKDTRVVLVEGPRQSGKTTLVRQLAKADMPYITLDEPSFLLAAQEDPIGFIRNLEKAVIDEIQRAPELLLVIKQRVDKDNLPGQFLLTGSANVMSLPKVADSLAGRLAIETLLPLAQAEIEGTNGSFIDRIFAGEFPQAEKVAEGPSLLRRVLRGGYPEALQRESDARRLAWHEDYLKLVLDRDVKDVANIEQLAKLPKLVRMLGEHAGQLLNMSSLASPMGLTVPTIQKYLTTLERLYLIRTVPPWYSNKLSRLIKTPKMQFLDSGLLAAMRLDAEASLTENRQRFGALLETFVFSEIMKLQTWSTTRFTISHFRTKEKDEVDFVLEDMRGRIVGIEVKSAATLRPADFDGLKLLKEAAGDKFVRGLILHDHDQVTPSAEKILGAPVSCLWTM